MPVVVDQDGKDVHHSSYSLSTSDLERIDRVQAPVFDKDALDPLILDNVIYINNRGGLPFKIIGTTHNVDRRGMDTKDPENYDMVLDIDLQNMGVMRIPCHDLLWISISFNKPNDSYCEGLPTQIIENPNGKRGSIMTKNGCLHLEVKPDPVRSPYGFRIQNQTAAKVYIQGFTHDPLEVSPHSKQNAVFMKSLDPAEHFEYTLEHNWRLWLLDWLQVTSAATIGETAYPSYSAGSRQSNTTDFRVGSITWYSMAKNVRPGMYVFIVANSKSEGPRFVLSPYQHESLNIVPLRQYIIPRS